MLGNCATGSPAMVTAPTITIRIEITIATMGRLMKNLDMAVTSLPFPPRPRNGFGFTTMPGPNLLHALGDHAFARLQSFVDDPLRCPRGRRSSRSEC